MACSQSGMYGCTCGMYIHRGGGGGHQGAPVAPSVQASHALSRAPGTCEWDAMCCHVLLAHVSGMHCAVTCCHVLLAPVSGMLCVYDAAMPADRVTGSLKASFADHPNMVLLRLAANHEAHASGCKTQPVSGWSSFGGDGLCCGITIISCMESYGTLLVFPTCSLQLRPESDRL